MQKPHAFVTLDALRGIAAIAVMAFHFRRALGSNPFPEGYLAVDFFFMLSGFVLTYAYQERLDENWATWSFFKTRIARLYPLYLLGLVLGLVYRLMQIGTPDGFSGRATAISFLLGLLILPGVHLADGMFPLNAPAWSLFFEYAANVLHALGLRRRSVKFLCATVVLAMVTLIVWVHHVGSVDTGARSMEVFSFPRVLLSYTAGMLLFRLWKSGGLRLPGSPLLACVALLAVMAIPVARRFHPPYELCAIIIAFPCILLMGASDRQPRFLGESFQLLGEASYAIYVLHFPVYQLYGQLWERVRRHPMEHNAPWSGLICMALTVVLAVLLDRTYDRFGRKFLREILLRSRAAGQCVDSRV